MKLSEKFINILFVLVVLTSGIIRYLQVKNYDTPFTYDQARDMLDIRVLGEFKDFKILGPTTSINGLRLGPFYYYFNLPAYWIGGGNPQALVYWNLILFLFTGGFIFWFFRKKNINLGFWVATIFLMSPQLFKITQYFWNANMATYLSVFYFLSLYNFWKKSDKKATLFLGLTAGLLTQFEAAFGIVCLAFSILIILLNKKLDRFKTFFIGLIPWFLPQIALEIRNKFQMTKLFLGIFNGTNQVLGDKLTIARAIESHWNAIRQFFEGQFILPFGGGLVLLVLATTVILINKKYRKIGLYFLGFLVFAFVFYVLIYRHELKVWYLESLRVWYCFMIGLGLVSLNKHKKIIEIIFILFFIRNFWLVVADQWKYIKNKPNDDPKKLANLIKNIDWVYEKTNGSGFIAYDFVPEVYDYSTQYLYWWYGQKKYGYMPEKISYRVKEAPEYIRLQNKFLGKTRPSDGKIVLIYETKSIYMDWLTQFRDYCVIDKKMTEWNTGLEVREKCKKL